MKTLLNEVLALKALDRAGWVREGIATPESVAAHSWGVAWLALALHPSHLDLARVLSMAILHDLAEVRVGDITPNDGVTVEDKARLEASAAAALLSEQPHLLEIWQEYAEGSSPEAKWVHQLDKLDMGLQALHYEQKTHKTLREFVDSALDKIDAPDLRALLGK